ncbi:NAD(P)-dependent oxidoreductase [Marinitenerispora sediminis]|uniref:6-phosphogluconate dehydrogenase n=1 Tax=Marinitenerispora sediminis TaxID=1931232 RepID=A0A368T546_9ACTN|nr:NAD(P)-binding domain-containing protein [Marinitenerispora sediminis]RCV50691.1 6-phosphogluconate dehydrogenase [Marinitenerispora sediminis]RCV56366.1 6-phosphogluconate dehydrogenase [Marinitenerispora sediminis]RCV58701.1 6-phosphogluconate dehydrogenase [Marinitenerispora sediminis]
MAELPRSPITVLGLGAMGRAFTREFLGGGHPTTVWNRTPGKDGELVAAGAAAAATIGEAVRASRLVVVCLLDHRSVHEALDPVAGALEGRAVVNLTSTTPDEARELAAWAKGHGIDYLDGGIMATPDMIGQPPASLLYSGSRTVFDEHGPALRLLGSADYFGEDAGLASLYDFALLAGMYLMFAGFSHGAAMMRSAGVPAAEFAERAVPWLTAMAQTIPFGTTAVDTGDYTTDVQSLDFNKAAVDAIVRASRDAGVGLDAIAPVKALIDRQVADGHGAESFNRIFEGLKPVSAPPLG